MTLQQDTPAAPETELPETTAETATEMPAEDLPDTAEVAATEAAEVSEIPEAPEVPAQEERPAESYADDPQPAPSSGGEGRYFGSVQFFKNVIFFVVVALVCAGLFFSVFYYRNYSATRGQLQDALAENEVPIIVPDLEGVEGDVLPYQVICPDLYAPQDYQATRRDGGVVYLTFDGAPCEETAELLELLEESEAKATFFIVGKGEDNAEALQAIAQAGHTLGIYSTGADYTTLYTSVESYLSDIDRVFAAIDGATGTKPTVLRFPGGSVNSYNAAIYRELMAEVVRRGFVPCDWNLSTNPSSDAATETAADAIRRVLASTEGLDRMVIQLSHDAETIDALPELLEALEEDDYRFAALTPQTKPVLFAVSP